MTPPRHSIAMIWYYQNTPSGRRGYPTIGSREPEHKRASTDGMRETPAPGVGVLSSKAPLWPHTMAMQRCAPRHAVHTLGTLCEVLCTVCVCHVLADVRKPSIGDSL